MVWHMCGSVLSLNFELWPVRRVDITEKVTEEASKFIRPGEINLSQISSVISMVEDSREQRMYTYKAAINYF